MTKDRDCRGVPGEDAASRTAHDKSELTMASGDGILCPNELIRDTDSPEGEGDGSQ